MKAVVQLAVLGIFVFCGWVYYKGNQKITETFMVEKEITLVAEKKRTIRDKNGKKRVKTIPAIKKVYTQEASYTYLYGDSVKEKVAKKKEVEKSVVIELEKQAEEEKAKLAMQSKDAEKRILSDQVSKNNTENEKQRKIELRKLANKHYKLTLQVVTKSAVHLPFTASDLRKEVAKVKNILRKAIEKRTFLPEELDSQCQTSLQNLQGSSYIDGKAKKEIEQWQKSLPTYRNAKREFTALSK